MDVGALLVDYTADVAEVYHRLALYFLGAKQSLDTFTLLRPPSNSVELSTILRLTIDVHNNRTGQVQLPSWVPDLRERMHPLPVRYSAAGLSHPSITAVSKEVISCLGKIIDTVRDVSVEPHDDFPTTLEVYERLQDFDRVAALQKPPGPGEEDETGVLWRTLIMNVEWRHNPASVENRALHLKWRQYFQSYVDGKEVESDAEISAWWDLMLGRGLSFDYSLYVTESGRLGLGRVGIRAGDKICVLLGGHAPFAIREQSRRDEFILLGHVYAHGLIDGEAMDMDEFPVVAIAFS